MHHNVQKKENGSGNQVNKNTSFCTNIKNIMRFQTIDSTHLQALRLAEKEDSEECVIISEEQTNGIGRCGKNWISSSGNLFVSILIKTRPLFVEKTDELGKLSLTTACAVRETIAYYISDSKGLCLHWPNDVYYEDKKISGILIATINDFLIVSVGINVNSSPALEDKCTASLKEILKIKDPINVLKISNILLKNIDNWFYFLKSKGFSYIKSYWMQNIDKLNCEVIIKNGLDSISGIFSDIDEYGRLVLKKCGKRLLISSGDLFMNQEGIIIKYD